MPAEASPQPTGILPFQTLRALIRDGELAADSEIAAEQVQPASLDLRLGGTAWRVPASFLPGEARTVLDRIRQEILNGLPELAGRYGVERTKTDGSAFVLKFSGRGYVRLR